MSGDGAVDAENLPAYSELLFQHPLYASVRADDWAYLNGLICEQIQFDMHCVGCERDATFKGRSDSTSANAASLVETGRTLKFTLFCQRSNHRYVSHVIYSGGHLTKFGQLPSIEDIAGAEIRKYRPLLRGGYFAELNRATGLASHGIGIGAFVYLRRIFEKLIFDHYARKVAQSGEIDGFASMRMDQKIAALADVLPPALVKNKAAYGILSKGLHQLDEGECKLYFPAVRASIINILEDDNLRASVKEYS